MRYTAGYLDSLDQELLDNFVDVKDRGKVEHRFREKVKKFHANHVALSNHEAVDVLVGMTWKNDKPMLLANEGSTLRHCKFYEAVGAGCAHATMLLSRLLPGKSETSIQLAAFMAAYVIFHVKSYVEGCGMGTHVTVLKDGNAQYLSDETISTLEQHFQAYMEFDALAVNFIGGRSLKDEGEALGTLNTFLRETRKGVEGLDKPVAKLDLDWTSDVSPLLDKGLEQVGGEAVFAEDLESSGN